MTGSERVDLTEGLEVVHGQFVAEKVEEDVLQSAARLPDNRIRTEISMPRTTEVYRS